jgi:hypothetical protein
MDRINRMEEWGRHAFSLVWVGARLSCLPPRGPFWLPAFRVVGVGDQLESEFGVAKATRLLFLEE